MTDVPEGDVVRLELAPKPTKRGGVRWQWKVTFVPAKPEAAEVSKFDEPLAAMKQYFPSLLGTAHEKTVSGTTLTRKAAYRQLRKWVKLILQSEAAEIPVEG